MAIDFEQIFGRYFGSDEWARDQVYRKFDVIFPRSSHTRTWQPSTVYEEVQAMPRYVLDELLATNTQEEWHIAAGAWHKIQRGMLSEDEYADHLRFQYVGNDDDGWFFYH